ncbi:ArsR/SmtB family transcription factor [Acidihalobacter prosperus]|uniref:ArsR/SmtB family transcription factor n=1 Tax=Acidihalobacter prosperus TaxID=160660 RepID=UPI0005006C37|nr:winged helix-turn-helix domain-containing protein [Acidihalobacter prosperus]
MNTYQMAEIGALLGVPAHMAILTVLMDGRALSASELAGAAAVSPQTASEHLARLVEVNMLKMERQGRHRYYRLASPEVARLLEMFMCMATEKQQIVSKIRLIGPRDNELRLARSCYDHLAGKLGVAICDCLVLRGVVELDDGVGSVTREGMVWLGEIGVSLPAALKNRSSRPLCRPCLDWSERRSHLAGRLGMAIHEYFIGRALLRKVPGTRALRLTQKGRITLRNVWGINSLL